MDCRTARQQWPAFRPGDDDLSCPEGAEVAAHLAECAECRVRFDREQQFDRRISALINDVPIPAGLHGRLLAALELQAAAPAAERTAEKPADEREGAAATAPAAAPPVAAAGPAGRSNGPDGRNRRRWMQRLACGLAAAMVLIGAGVAWQAMFGSLPEARLADLLPELVRDETTTAPAEGIEVGEGDVVVAGTFGGDVPPELPRDVRLPQLNENVGSLKLRGREVGAVYWFSAGSRRDPLPGVVVVLDLRRVKIVDPELPAGSFAEAAIRYENRLAVKVWARGDFVYICFIKTRGPQPLESLAQPTMST